MTGGAGNPHARHRTVTGRVEGWRVDVRRAELEAARSDVGCAVAAGAAAVEVAGRNVRAARPTDDGDVGERPDALTVTGEAARHALVDAGDGVERVVTRRGVALGAGRGGRDVIRGLAAGGHIRPEGRSGGMAAAAVARRRMYRIERRRGTRIAGAGVGAQDHAEVLGTLVAGLTRSDGGRHGRVSRNSQRRRIDVS